MTDSTKHGPQRSLPSCLYNFSTEIQAISKKKKKIVSCDVSFPKAQLTFDSSFRYMT